MAEKRKRNKKHSVLWQLRWYILLIVEIALVISIFKISKYRKETAASEAANRELAQAVTVNTPESAGPDEVSASAKSNSAADGADAVSTLQMAEDSGNVFPITVNFDLLHSKNRDCVGWLYCADTPINLAVLQADDNTYYLSHTFDKVENGYGTIYLECNCSPDFKDANQLIFGHDMKNETMFGSLRNYSRQEYYEAHPCLWLATPNHNYRLDVVAGMAHASDSVLYSTPISRPVTDELVPYAIQNSIFKSDAVYNPQANYLTLSTCSDYLPGGRLAIICEIVEIK